MGNPHRKRPEVVDAGNRQAEMVAILRHYFARVQRGELVGIMIIAELPRGAYTAHDLVDPDITMSGTENVAERLGRIDLLHAHVLDLAREDLDRVDEEENEGG